MNPQLHVVIPVHNRKEQTRRLLICLQKQNYAPMQIVIVDDGSSDGTSEMIREEFASVVLLQGSGALWWTGATNVGVRYALGQGSEVLVTLNNDVIVAGDYLQRLVEAHQSRSDALIGSIELTQGDPPCLLYAGIKDFNPWTAKYQKHGRWLQPYAGDLRGLLPSYSLSGRGVLIPRKVFASIGLYDEKSFPHYAADVDFSRRAARAGFPLFVHAENPVYSPYEPMRPDGVGQSLGNYLRSFINFRSSNYLPVSLRFNYRHHPYKWYFPIFALLDLTRKCFGFILTKYGKNARNRIL